MYSKTIFEEEEEACLKLQLFSVFCIYLGWWILYDMYEHIGCYGVKLTFVYERKTNLEFDRNNSSFFLDLFIFLHKSLNIGSLNHMIHLELFSYVYFKQL